MSTEAFNTMRKNLVESVTGSALDWLAYMGTDAALAAIPDTTPPRYVVVGTLADIVNLLPATEAIHPPLTAPEPLTDVKLQAAIKWLNSAQHGDNCFVSDHYEGDPGDRCNCGKDSLLEYLESDEVAPAPQQSELTPRRIEQIGYAMRIQAFENAKYRAEQGSAITGPEQDEFNTLVAFARAIEAECRAKLGDAK